MTLILISGIWINMSHVIGMWNAENDCVVHVRDKGRIVIENMTCEQFLANPRTIKVE